MLQMPPSIAPNQHQETLDSEQKEEVEKWTVAFRNQNNVTKYKELASQFPKRRQQERGKLSWRAVAKETLGDAREARARSAPLACRTSVSVS
ncbi:hypothetical protein NDU88_008354 [Pleurodeles waltl]|uniref:Uncharacterized protein n=1 Tax=Pleurodeles waltl TaxID=8319 RepID=A0AAV7PWE8_PLEWA|nr:hypothetical protein NDU88_008354 [Pleurodeles waltl]